jgi:hypothetical protein
VDFEAVKKYISAYRDKRITRALFMKVWAVWQGGRFAATLPPMESSIVKPRTSGAHLTPKLTAES